MVESARRQLIGRRSKESGAIFERWISNACEYYSNLGIAHIEKTPEPFHVNRNNKDGTMTGFFEKKGQPDYKGLLCDGTGIMFEAKHTDQEKINQRAVTETQWKNLDAYENFGAHCYVMVSIGLVEFYRVPWKIWKQMKELFGRKYMNAIDLEPYKLKQKNCTILMLEGVVLKNED